MLKRSYSIFFFFWMLIYCSINLGSNQINKKEDEDRELHKFLLGYIDEKENLEKTETLILKKFPDKAERKDRTLVIKIKPNPYEKKKNFDKLYKNKVSKANAAPMGKPYYFFDYYYLIDYYEKISYYLVIHANNDGPRYILIEEKYGEEYELDGFPIFYKDFSQFVVASDDWDGTYNDNSLTIYKLGYQRPYIVFRCQPQRWGPGNPFWQNENELSFEKNYLEEDKEPVVKKCKLIYKTNLDQWDIIEK